LLDRKEDVIVKIIRGKDRTQAAQCHENHMRKDSKWRRYPSTPNANEFRMCLKLDLLVSRGVPDGLRK
jgi:hypothetical protein